MIRIPSLRLGKPYESLSKTTLVHHVTGEPVAEVSQVTGSQIMRDISQMANARRELAAIPMKELLARVKEAAKIFLEDTLDCGDSSQSFDDYIRMLSSTTGSPMVFCRRNAAKVGYVMGNMDEILAGLTRGMDLSILDKGHGKQDGRTLCFYPTTDALGAILPSNSPGVHSLWVPAIALKIPLVIKPGREEPWTPFRLLMALKKAKIPASALNFLPTDHAGAADILRGCQRSLLFGDSTTTDPYKADHRVEIHGPGYSKVLLGADTSAHFERYLDLLVESVAANGGRSCINASAIYTHSHARELAEALGSRLARIQARAWDNTEAEVSAFANPDVADRISGMIDGLLATPGAEDVCQRIRGTPRVHKEGRCAWLLPSVVLCDSPEHPLANKEFLFPYVSIIQCPQEEMLARIGPSLVVSAITGDPEFAQQLLDSKLVERLNIGPISTVKLSWDQPHEGNLFSHLYRQRAFAEASL